MPAEAAFLDATDTLGWPTGAPPLPEFSGPDQRARVLSSYDFDSLEREGELAGIARFAASLCEAPVALVSIIDGTCERILAGEGVDWRELSLADSFCALTMLGGEMLEARDASTDPAFSGMGLVSGPEHVRFYAGMPLISREGAPLGAVCVIDRQPRPEGLTLLQREGLTLLAQTVMRRLALQRALRVASRETEETWRHMRGIADLVPAIIWSADGEGEFDYFNRRWTELTGVERPKTVTDWRRVVHEDDADSTFAAWQTSMQLGEPFECEYRLKRADGGWRWTLSRGLPVRSPEGGVARWYGTLTDVDKSRRLSQARDLLARELSHRIKNIFAVLSGLVAIRARKYPDSRAFADELTSAIFALGRAHEFVGPIDGEKGESMHGLLSELMAPYEEAGRGEERIRIQGGDCKIGPRAATPLALVFHELATNAVKYGALANEAGQVDVHLDCPDSGETTTIHWRERGGPAVTPAVEEGFGSRLLRTAVEGQLGGKLKRRFEPGGLEVEIELKSEVINR